MYNSRPACPKGYWVALKIFVSHFISLLGIVLFLVRIWGWKQVPSLELARSRRMELGAGPYISRGLYALNACQLLENVVCLLLCLSRRINKYGIRIYHAPPTRNWPALVQPTQVYKFPLPSLSTSQNKLLEDSSELSRESTWGSNGSWGTPCVPNQIRRGYDLAEAMPMLALGIASWSRTLMRQESCAARLTRRGLPKIG